MFLIVYTRIQGREVRYFSCERNVRHEPQSRAALGTYLIKIFGNTFILNVLF